MGTRVLYALPALLLAALALILALVGLSREPAPAPPGASPSQHAEEARSKSASMHRYWALAQAVPAGEPLTENTLVEVSSASPLPGGLGADQKLVGKSLKRDVRAGEILTQRHFDDSGRPLPDVVPEGFRALAISVDNVVGAGGLLQPGDRVDVLSAFKRGGDKKGPAALVIQEGLEVLAVHGELADGPPQKEEDRRRNANNTVVLAVPEEKVTGLLLASTESTLRLAVVGSGVRASDEDDPLPAEDGEQAEPVLASNDTEAEPTAKPFYLEDFFPKEKQPARAPVVRQSPGHRVQVFEGSEARSTYVR
ncbi:Flp pilus assembly protein CpaB [Alloalcanivorax xenomutans]|jgi:pilus assembly protein CpaB|uniref:Flp pilus assembly protein CpaB n=1 Tax=Alloalcanivorax xenomutans TaxID=1094342 RepID=UPI0017D0F310|nr:Flp pilus assembly protein CpaB [Alloalcanivorax xenomutans]MBA4719499.1 Flp pilus assembly protein CpaB [Alcanivorax sp.]MCE7523029.1 Flp pilus assembly protein CpaB [Alloalcanivorax xenomutans]